jgi:hypothetical protein
METAKKKAGKRLTRIGVMSTATTLAALYGILGLVYALLYAVIIAAFGALLGATGSTSAGVAAFGMGVLVIVILAAAPVIFAIMGFIVGGLMALIYNFVAKYTGGIAFEVSG